MLTVQNIYKGVRSGYKIKRSISTNFKKIPSPLFMVWEATHDCNLNCSYCYTKNISNKELRTDAVMKIVKEASQIGLFSLVVSGGEPLLRGDIFKIREYAKNLGLFVSLTTNGTLISDDNFEEISKFDHITVSLDSEHSPFFKSFVFDGNNDIDVLKIVEKIKKKAKKTKLNIQIVIDENNFRNILDFNDKFYGIGVDAIYQLKNGRNFEIDEEFWTKAVDKMKFRSRAIGIISRKFLKLFPKIVRDDYKSPCLVLTSNFVVSPDGYMLPCNFVREPLFNLNEVSLTTAWNGMKTLRNYYSSERRECSCGNSCFIPPAIFLT